ncbi:hypothetical protein IV203_035230 [Nitzschia inconspicua]|uniref:Uncharacterized protein n=1 Tax=Nitzschia inconspicua TaxID=303405 RepID=A0A9K3PUQ9_9STRA|nr:hypothetical protein IV203_035230 [Nitzschia inconspicua]
MFLPSLNGSYRNPALIKRPVIGQNRTRVYLQGKRRRLYYVVVKSDSSVFSDSTFNESNWDECSIPDSGVIDDEQFLLQRLFDQNVDILLEYLRGIFARRLVLNELHRQSRIASWEEEPEFGVSILEEAREVVQMPIYDLRLAVNAVDTALVEVPPLVESQLRNYVSSVASVYRHINAFHSFEHASHMVRIMDQMISKMKSFSEGFVTGVDGKPRSTGEIAKEVEKKNLFDWIGPTRSIRIDFCRHGP